MVVGNSFSFSSDKPQKIVFKPESDIANAIAIHCLFLKYDFLRFNGKENVLFFPSMTIKWLK